MEFWANLFMNPESTNYKIQFLFQNLGFFNWDQNSKQTYAWLITYFGNLFFGFSSLRFPDFLHNVFHLQGKMGKTKLKIKKLLCNILINSLPKTTKNEVTKMGWNAPYFIFLYAIIRPKLNIGSGIQLNEYESAPCYLQLN